MTAKQTIPTIIYEKDQQFQFWTHRILTVNQIGYDKGHYWKIDGKHLTPYGTTSDPDNETTFKVALLPDNLVCIGDHAEEHFLAYRKDKEILSIVTKKISKIEEAKKEGLIFIKEIISDQIKSFCLKPFYDEDKILAFDKDGKPTIMDRQGKKGEYIRWTFWMEQWHLQ